MPTTSSILVPTSSLNLRPTSHSQKSPERLISRAEFEEVVTRIMQSDSIRRWVSPVVLAMLTVAGCTKVREGRVRVYPVSGKVTSKGQPVEGAEVVFYGATPDLTGPGTPAPAGITDANGEFTLRSYVPDDGAPAGKFNVTVYWPEPIPPGVDTEMYERKDRFKGRYMEPGESGLTVEVPEGGGELPPLEL
jgi:hypothetical protein